MDILVRIFQTLIEEMHGFTGDYGIAIVLVTVMIRLLLIPLNVRGRRQMEKQQELGRAVEEIKERHTAGSGCGDCDGASAMGVLPAGA